MVGKSGFLDGIRSKRNGPNPVDGSDSSGDPDGDGMTNWEEYGSIINQDNEISSIVSVPQFYLFVVGI